MQIYKTVYSLFLSLREANVLIFPNLESANISYKLLQQLGKVEIVGPFLLGVRRAANVLQRTTTEQTIFNTTVLTALEAQVIQDKRSESSKKGNA